MSRTKIQYNLKVLSQAKSTRAFLGLALGQHYQKRGKVNLADFSRRAGFLSRSFLSEYLAGRKSLSQDSFKRIKDALKLPKAAAEFFHLLAVMEQPELAGPRLQKHGQTSQLSTLRARLENADEITSARLKDPTLVKSVQVHQIYASLGALETGASREEIASRTRLSDQTTENCLSMLLSGSAKPLTIFPEPKGV